MSMKTFESMINWIEDNIMDNPKLSEMSEYVGYSSFYCSSKFKENFGITFKKYVARRRVSLAAVEIINTGIGLLEIALKYGYSSYEAFTRAFIDNFGCTPNQYRRKFAVTKNYSGSHRAF